MTSRPLAAGRMPRRARRAEQGIALVLALWLTVLLMILGSGFAFSMRNEAIAARNAMSAAQARAVADGATDRMVYELSRPKGLTTAWQPDGQAHSWVDGEAALTAVAFDESAKIDLNTAQESLLRGLLQNVGGLQPDEAQAIVEGVLDWRDPDDLRRPNGAEEAEYRAAGRKYKPSNATFESVGELRRVLGVTQLLYDRIAGVLTVYSRQAGINPLTASRDVLLAVPNATADMVDAYIAQRSEALAAKLTPPPFPLAQGVTVGPIPVWRIQTEAVMPDGVKFVREAVIRASADPRRPYLTYLWQEGSALPAPPPAQAVAQPDTYGIFNKR